MENIIRIVPAVTKHNFANRGYLTFEDVTLVPIQQKMIMTELLTQDEVFSIIFSLRIHYSNILIPWLVLLMFILYFGRLATSTATTRRRRRWLEITSKSAMTRIARKVWHGCLKKLSLFNYD